MAKKILTILFLITLAGLPASSFAQTAASPVILLTWSSNTYVPPEFGGKIMPTANSTINASAELIDNGKIIDVSKQNVYWYQDNNYIDGGIGKQSISFKAPDFSGGSINLRVEFPDYSKGDQLKTVAIPIAKPEVVIESPLPGEKFSSSPLTLEAQPYFFNVDSLSGLIFSWNVNGQSPSGAENPQVLNIKFDQTLQPQSTMSVSLSVQNATKGYESEAASKNIMLTYSP
ncbi:MAG TPA: hypothetical protein VMV71_01655 [Candidatus Paceibacterota bacterium]|nr:hypothetical protein [Candidatus Paceibacterota bacterium]